MSSAVIEVVLALVFVYFLFSMICSGINELISRALGKRADFLAAGLWSMLDHSPDAESKGAGDGGEGPEKYFEAFQKHPLVRQLGQVVSEADAAGRIRTKWRGVCGWVRERFTSKALQEAVAPIPGGARHYEDGRLRPSYIPPGIFATVMTSFLRAENRLPTVSTGGAAQATAEEERAADRRRKGGSPLEKSLQALVDEAAGDAGRLRAGLEHWYDAQMERVSGWYKRESKRVLLVLAFVVVLLMNVDTLAIAGNLWTNPTARRTLADAAQQQIEAAAATTTTLAVDAPGAPGGAQSDQANPSLRLSCPDPTAADDAGTATPTPTTTKPGHSDAVGLALECAKSLPLPIGWRLPEGCGNAKATDSCGFLETSSYRVKHAWTSFVEAAGSRWLVKILGWALTIGALSFGAPFWFDLLNRFGSLRAAGPKPKQSELPG